VTLIVTISYKTAAMRETGPELSLGQARSIAIIDQCRLIVVLGPFPRQ
jgi:hypothetical protein